MEEAQPLFVYPVPKTPTWTNIEGARLMESPSLPMETAQSQLRRFVQQGWIHHAGQRGTANMLPPAALLAGRVLSSLASDLGLEDREAVGYAARALYAREAGEPQDDLPEVLGSDGKPKKVAPVVAAALGASRQPWAFVMTVFRGDQSGRRDIRAACYNPDVWTPHTRPPMPEMLPLWSATLMLGPLLLPLHTRMVADLERRARQG